MGYIKIILNATSSGRRLYEKYGFKDVTGEMVYKEATDLLDNFV